MLFAWIASLIYGINSVVAKLTAKHAIPNPWLFNFVWSLVVLIGTIPIALANHVNMPTEWAILILTGFFSFLTGAIYVIAIYQLDVSILGPLYNFRPVFTSIIGAAFLSEVLTGNQYFLIAIIFIAGIFLNVDEHFKLKAFFKKNTMLGMLAVLTSAMFGFTVKAAIAQNGFWTTSLWIAVFTQIFLLATIPLFYKNISDTPLDKYSGVILTGIFSIFGDLAANKAYGENVTLATVIMGIPFSMIIAFAFSIFAPHLLEKHPIRIYGIRFIAATVMIVAALSLTAAL